MLQNLTSSQKVRIRKFIPFLMYYAPVAISTLSSEKPALAGTVHLHHQPCFTLWHGSCHSNGSDFFLALCSQQPFRVYWGGREGGNILLTSSALFSHVGMILATLQALTSQQPFRVYWGGGRGGGKYYLHDPLSFTPWNFFSRSKGSHFFSALCPKQPFKV